MLSKPLLTTHEVAELLKIKEATVRRWIRDGELPAVLFHREWRISAKHLEEYVERRLTNVASDSSHGARQEEQTHPDGLAGSPNRGVAPGKNGRKRQCD